MSKHKIPKFLAQSGELLPAFRREPGARGRARKFSDPCAERAHDLMLACQMLTDASVTHGLQIVEEMVLLEREMTIDLRLQAG